MTQNVHNINCQISPSNTDQIKEVNGLLIKANLKFEVLAHLQNKTIVFLKRLETLYQGDPSISIFVSGDTLNEKAGKLERTITDYFDQVKKTNDLGKILALKESNQARNLLKETLDFQNELVGFLTVKNQIDSKISDLIIRLKLVNDDLYDCLIDPKIHDLKNRQLFLEREVRRNLIQEVKNSNKTTNVEIEKINKVLLCFESIDKCFDSFVTWSRKLFDHNLLLVNTKKHKTFKSPSNTLAAIRNYQMQLDNHEAELETFEQRINTALDSSKTYNLYNLKDSLKNRFIFHDLLGFLEKDGRLQDEIANFCRSDLTISFDNSDGGFQLKMQAIPERANLIENKEKLSAILSKTWEKMNHLCREEFIYLENNKFHNLAPLSHKLN